MSSRELSAESHRARADQHERLGRVLAETDQEWAAVCLFYAAYHHVKAALLEDVVFDDPIECQKINSDLLPQDRFTTRHQGRKHTSNGREWGINELVLVLYRGAVGAYERLHQMSVDVRYQSGLRGTPADALEAYERFNTLRLQGALATAPLTNDPLAEG